MSSGPAARGRGLTRELRLHGRRNRLAAVLLGLALLGSVGTIGLAFRTLAEQTSDAARIDLAGRQRMLNERHLKEALLALDGAEADLERTRRDFFAGLETLRRGGRAEPARLEAHRRAMERQAAAVDALLATDPGDPRRAVQLAVVRGLSEELGGELDRTVLRLDEESAARARRGLVWTGAAATLMLLTGLGLFWQFRRIAGLNRRLRSEERRHRQVSSHLEAVVASVVDGIVSIDEQGVVETFNRAAERIFGYTEAEVVGRNVKMLMPEPYRSEHDGYIDLYRRTGTARIIGTPREVEGRRKDGSVFPLELAVSEATTGERQRFVGVVRDLTAQKAAAEALRQSQERFQLAVDGSAAGLWDWDVVSGEVWYAPRFKQMLGYDDAGFPNVFDSFDSHLHPEDRDDTLERVRLHLEERVPYDVEYRLRTRDGSYRWFQARGQALWDADGKPFRMAGSIVDITARIEIREALREATEQAVAANRAKSQFLANMSHELRTPLNAIIGYSELLAEEAEERAIDGFTADLGKIRSAGRQLLGLINDVLDLSKVEAGRLELAAEAFELDEMLAETVATVEPLFESRGNRLELEPAGGVTVTADRARLRQVLLNLISNANKFTEQGRITVRASAETLDGDEGVRIEVADTGIGIAADQLERVFEPFAQADSSTTRKYGGTGLGLAISRQLCERMGGSIAAASEPGRGSTFTVRLPRAGGAERPAPPAEPAGGGDTVLVIDDDPTARELLGRMLGRAGFAVATASSGREGLRLARQLRPAVVTLDVMMPGMDGWAVLAEIKQDPELSAIPVILATMIDDRHLGLALGAADFLSKPIDRDQLLAAVGRHRASREPGSILLVDDDPGVRSLVGRSLAKAGWQIAEAANGVEALDELRRRSVDLVLLDLMMPRMDGFTLLDHLRAAAEWRDLPVIVLTARELTAAERRRLDGSVQRVLQKGSHDRQELLDEVQRHIRRLAASRGR